MEKIIKTLSREIDGTSIAIFRIGFGFLMIWEMMYFMRINFVEVFLTSPQLQLYYEFAPFLKVLPTVVLEVLVVLLLVASCLLLIGKYFRVAAILFFLVFSYLFLLDKAYYNNHLYLVGLISFMFIFIPADHRLSLSKRWINRKNPVRYWHLFVLRLQIVIVYFYGGVAKLNYDWLVSQQPARVILQNKAESSWMGDFLVSDAMVYFITYGGVVFDLVIGFALFVPKIRRLAIIAAIAFNVLNAWIFSDINIFPYFMIIALVLFMDADKVSSYFKFLRAKEEKNKSKNKKEPARRMIAKPMLYSICLFFLVQCLLPLRHFLIKDNTDWTGYGQRFAWRMKIQNRKINTLEFKVYDNNKKIVYPVDFRSYGLNRDQITTLAQDPRAAVHFARFLKEHCRKNKGMPNVSVKSIIDVSFNGRTSQLVFDTDTDLSSLKDKEIKASILKLN